MCHERVYILFYTNKVLRKITARIAIYARAHLLALSGSRARDSYEIREWAARAMYSLQAYTIVRITPAPFAAQPPKCTYRNQSRWITARMRLYDVRLQAATARHPRARHDKLNGVLRINRAHQPSIYICIVIYSFAFTFCPLENGGAAKPPISSVCTHRTNLSTYIARGAVRIMRAKMRDRKLQRGTRLYTNCIRCAGRQEMGAHIFAVYIGKAIVCGRHTN